MATFAITLPSGTSVVDGKQLTFKAPTDCTEDLTGIDINGTTFSLVDASNNGLTSGSFKQDAMVSVILDTVNNRAFLLNGTSCAAQLITWEEGE